MCIFLYHCTDGSVASASPGSLKETPEFLSRTLLHFVQDILYYLSCGSFRGLKVSIRISYLRSGYLSVPGPAAGTVFPLILARWGTAKPILQMREWRLREVTKLVNDGTGMQTQISEPLLILLWDTTPRDH